MKRSIAAVLAGLTMGSVAAADVLNDHYTAGRTGANLTETTLTTTNVTASQFGRIWSYPVDGSLYAQPLYKSGVAIPGVGTVNVLYVATMKDKLYAFNADSPSGVPLWSRDFRLAPNVTAANTIPFDGGNGNVDGTVGIMSTPVIDPSTGTLYAIARTIENGAYVQRLHAVDITTGADKFGGSVEITASVPGTGYDAVNGVITFNPELQNQRSSLALANGVVVAAWGAHEDIDPYHGWIMGFNAATLAEVGVICDTPNGTRGGIWQSGRGPAVDSAGNIYYETGNGDFDGVHNFGSSVLKLNVSTSGIAIATPTGSGNYGWYTPSNWATINAEDADLSSTGPLLIPGTDVIVAGGKFSVLYQIHTTTSLGGLDINNTTPTTSVNGGEMKSGASFWTSASLGSLLFTWPQQDYLKSFYWNGTVLTTSPYKTAADLSQASPGGSLTVSANGSADASAIVWALTTTAPNNNNGGDNGVVPGILRAYQATTLAALWTSETNAVRDRLGSLNKFVVPVVANGRVYAVTQDNDVVVYGLLSSAPVAGFSMSLLDRAATVTAGQNVVLRGEATVVNSSATLPTLAVSGLPGSATATVVPPATLPGLYTVAISTTSATPAGVYPVKVTATAGSSSVTDTSTLTVAAPSTASTAVPVNLAAVANVSGIYNDGKAFTSGGLDTAGYAYSAYALGAPLYAGTTPFFPGAANAANAVSGVAIPLPAGYFSSLQMLAAGVNGNQPNSVFIVNYTDGSSSTATVSLSDWCKPQNYAGETVVRQMAYRLYSTGKPDTVCTSVNLYGYSIPVTAGKLVKSLTPPSNPGVRVVALSAVRAFNDLAVSLQSVANLTGIFTDGAKYSSSGIDGAGYAYSSRLIGTAQTWAGHSFSLGTAGAADAASNVTVPLPANASGALRFLATALNGAQTAQTFTVTYTDGSTATLTQSLSDWCGPKHYSNETVVATLATRDFNNGTSAACGANPVNLYGYAMALDPSRTTASLKLPATTNVAVLAVTLSPAELATPVTFGSTANVEAISPDGAAVVSGGLDGSGYAYSVSTLPTNLNWAGTPFVLGVTNAPNSVSNATVTLPAGSFAGLRLLGTGIFGNQTGQTFTITYTDGTTASNSLSLSDWCGAAGNAGETVVLNTVYRDLQGAPLYDCLHESLYGYLIPLDSSRTPKSLTLPANRDVVIIGATLQ